MFLLCLLVDLRVPRGEVSDHRKAPQQRPRAGRGASASSAHRILGQFIGQETIRTRTPRPRLDQRQRSHPHPLAMRTPGFHLFGYRKELPCFTLCPPHRARRASPEFGHCQRQEPEGMTFGDSRTLCAQTIDFVCQNPTFSGLNVFDDVAQRVSKLVYLPGDHGYAGI